MPSYYAKLLGMSGSVQVGKVSTRKGAKLHLALHGLASCGSGTGRILGHARDLITNALPALCRRCVRRIKALVADAIAAVMRRRDSTRLSQLNKVADALATPAERAAEQRILASVAAGLKAGVDGRRARSLAEIREFHLAAVERDRAARAGQPALFAA
jgi:hypothetical protein